MLLELPSILALIALCQVFPVLGEESAALGAGVGEGFEISGKLAIRVVTATVKGAFLFAELLHYLGTALRALSTRLNLEGFSIFALRVTTTG
ncbi:hypothetical protein ES703_85141 [subsurface metagenome]